MNRATLQDREEWFIERLKEQNRFKYVGGYRTMKDDVILKHIKCGKTVVQKAYTVIYSDIDACYECSRHRRGYSSIAGGIKHSPTIAIIGRDKFKTRYRYKCKCRVCGEEYFFNKNQLEQGIVCCSGTSSRIDKIVKSKSIEIVRYIKSNANNLKELNLNQLAKDSFNDIALLRTCVADVEKLFTKIANEVEAILEKKEIKACPCCKKIVIKKLDWKVDFSNNKRKICKDCKTKK
jgi:hypothetical protein